MWPPMIMMMMTGVDCGANIYLFGLDGYSLIQTTDEEVYDRQRAVVGVANMNYGVTATGGLGAFQLLLSCYIKYNK